MTESQVQFKTWMCLICGFVYDEAAGLPDEGIAPGTRWDDVPMNWTCPECGARKDDFEMVPGADITVTTASPNDRGDGHLYLGRDESRRENLLVEPAVDVLAVALGGHALGGDGNPVEHRDIRAEPYLALAVTSAVLDVKPADDPTSPALASAR